HADRPWDGGSGRPRRPRNCGTRLYHERHGGFVRSHAASLVRLALALVAARAAFASSLACWASTSSLAAITFASLRDRSMSLPSNHSSNGSTSFSSHPFTSPADGQLSNPPSRSAIRHSWNQRSDLEIGSKDRK